MFSSIPRPMEYLGHLGLHLVSPLAVIWCPFWISTIILSLSTRVHLELRDWLTTLHQITQKHIILCWIWIKLHVITDDYFGWFIIMWSLCYLAIYFMRLLENPQNLWYNFAPNHHIMHWMWRKWYAITGILVGNWRPPRIYIIMWSFTNLVIGLTRLLDP